MEISSSGVGEEAEVGAEAEEEEEEEDMGTEEAETHGEVSMVESTKGISGRQPISLPMLSTRQIYA